MKLAEVQINLWDNLLKFEITDQDLKIGDYVIVEISSNNEIGKVTNIMEIDDKQFKKIKTEEEIAPVIKKADLKDLEQLESYEKQKEEALSVCKKLIDKHQLPMKLVDVHFSFDNKKMTFAFIADSRVDFRLLVKDLTRNFQRNIRLQQLGVRDEAKINGDIGACGVTQCCKTHLKTLGNVGAEQAEAQQVSHRGPERLSGICNRLKCCLRYENDLYEELAKNLPAIGSKVKTPRGKGEVVEWHTLKQTVNVRLDQDQETLYEVPLDEIN